MTNRREFLRNATTAASLIASIRIARAATAPPVPPNPLVINGQSATSGFLGDPYSAYTTWYVDQASGVDPAVGSHKAAGYVYQTYQAALVDVFYAPGLGQRRIIVRASAAWNGGSSTAYVYNASSVAGYFPAGSGDSSNPYVIQGDPASANCPIIDGGLNTSNAAFGFGNQGSYNTGPITVTGAVVRKFEIRNFECDSCYFYYGTSSYVTIEYCYIHGNEYPTSNPSSAGGIGISSANCTSYLTVRYCKFSNFTTVSGGYQLNCVPIETYGSNYVTINNCLFTGNYAAIRTKLLDGSGTANNWTVSSNIFAGNYEAILQGTNGNGFLGNSNWVISNNLFYGPAQAMGGPLAWGNQGYAESQGSNITVSNNTLAEDMTRAFGWIGATGVVVRDNVMMDSQHCWTPDKTDSYWTANSAIVFSQFDYNAYAVSSSWGLDWNQSNYSMGHAFSSFKAWQSAYTSSSAPDLAGISNPDGHGLWIPNLASPYNTEAANFPNYASRDYTISAGSPLLTASSTGGPVGYNSANCGPGW